jgi:hypothetical protein
VLAAHLAAYFVEGDIERARERDEGYDARVVRRVVRMGGGEGARAYVDVALGLLELLADGMVGGRCSCEEIVCRDY